MVEKTIEILGLRVRYLETNGEEVPLILLHGWGSSLDSWRRVAENFEREGIKIFIPDLPGFGKTPEPEKVWNLDDYIKFVQMFASGIGAKKFSLAGHSFGGQIAIGYAVKYPNFVNKLILMAAARIMHRRKLKIKLFLIITTIGKIPFSVPPLSFLKPLVQKIWYRTTGERDYYRASARMKKTMSLVLSEEMSPRLSDLHVPTLICWGDKDDVTPLADGRIIHERVAGSRMKIFDGVGHDLNFKRPDELAKEMLKFIQ